MTATQGFVRVCTGLTLLFAVVTAARGATPNLMIVFASVVALGFVELGSAPKRSRRTDRKATPRRKPTPSTRSTR